MWTTLHPPMPLVYAPARMSPDPSLTRSYYLTALTALRYLDERTGRRRFGVDADARWSGFAGDEPADRPDARVRLLREADRIDLILRDADAQWPGAFGARTVFDLPEVAEDDAFGAEWESDLEGFELWHRVMTAPLAGDVADLLPRLATVWDAPIPDLPLPLLRPNSRWLLRGAGAAASAIRAFLNTPDAVWHSQVLVVAEPPLAAGISPRQQRRRTFARQLAALAAGLLNQPQRTRILRSAPAPSEYPGHERLISEDAES